MGEEMSALHQNWAWELIVLSFGKQTVGCHWVYTIKDHLNGFFFFFPSLEQLEGWLVAKR